MARHGVEEKEFIYVADSALITEKNISLMKEDIYFVARLPESLDLYGRKCRAVVVHSSAHGKRRQKRIDKAVRKDAEAVS